MWALLTGYLLSIFFKSQTVELFKNKFSNETLSFVGVLVGWLFQEYIREEFDLTGGKRFMLEGDFRNRMFTQSLKIVKDLMVYPYLITILELGTFVLVFGSWITIIYWPKFVELKKKVVKFVIHMEFKNYDCFLNKTFVFIYSNWNLRHDDMLLFFFLGFIFKHEFLSAYFWYDIIFLFRPFFLLLLTLFELFPFIFIVYIVYIYMLFNLSKNWMLTLKLFVTKLFFFVIIVVFYLALGFYDLDFQSLRTENFFKEEFFKIFTIFYQTIRSKHDHHLL